MSYFPDPTRNGGIAYMHYDEVPRDFASVTDSYEYEDAGRDFNRRTSNPPRVWEITFIGGLTKTQTDQFDRFWEGVGIDVGFSFEDKYGLTYSNVRVQSYSRSHDAHKAWDKKVSFTLIQYVAEDLTPPTAPGLSVEALDDDSLRWTLTTESVD